MSKLQADPRLYEAWDKFEKRHKESLLLFGKDITQQEVADLSQALVTAEKASTGRNRKKDEELVLVPRGLLKYLTSEAYQYAFYRETHYVDLSNYGEEENKNEGQRVF